MNKLKISEIFYSIQGEGRYVGVPSVFLRTFGCNFTCSGFGCTPGVRSTEADEVAKNVHLYKTFEELPLVNTGCDSYASWHPAFKQLSPMLETDEIVTKIMELLPHKQWCDEHLVITGGEPLLGWQRAYPDLLDEPVMQSLKEITFETNGTQKLSTEFKDYLAGWGMTDPGREITFSVSAKLPGSGENWAEAIQPEIVCEYEQVGTAYLKFVVATEQDVKDADEAVYQYRKAGFGGPVYLMPCGGVPEMYNLNVQQVAELAMRWALFFCSKMFSARK